MAISAACVWEVNTSGASTNGGGFVTGASGTDSSGAGATPLFALTGLTSAGAGDTVLSASASSTMIGNIAQCTSGTNFTTGFFEVLSVSAGVSITFGTNSAGTSICTGVGASGVVNIGGTWKFANSALDATWATSVRPGNTVWVKLGSYTASGFTFPNATLTTPINVLGYQSSHGDNPTGANRPAIDLGSNTLTTGTYGNFRNFILTSSATNRTFLAGLESVTKNCKVTNTASTASAASAIASSGESLVYSCEMISRGIGFGASARMTLDTCYIHDCNNGIFVDTGSYGIFVFNTIVAGCSTNAVNLSAAAIPRNHFKNCTFYGFESKSAVGIVTVASVGTVSVSNCIFYGFTTALSIADSVQNFFSDFNAYNNNTAVGANWTQATTDITLNPTFTSVQEITGTTATTAASILTDNSADFSNVVDGQDYCYLVSGTGITVGIYPITAHSLHTITLGLSPGNNATGDKVYKVRTGQNFAVGANMKAAGLGGMPGALSTGYIDIGAVQRLEQGGSFTFVTG